MELKRLTLRHKKRITALFRDVFTSAPWYDDWSNPSQLDAYIEDLAGNSNSLTFGFFDGNQLIALCIGSVRHWHAGTEYVVDEFCVAREYQSKGVGAAFLRAIEAYLPAFGIRGIFLQTGSDVPAYTFYLHNGFRELTGHVSLLKRLGPRE